MMDGIKESFLRRLEEMWDKEKLYQFVSEQVNWMYEDLQSPGEIKASFLNTFHDELVSLADAMAGPVENYRKLMEQSVQPILMVKGIPTDFPPGRISRVQNEHDFHFDGKKIKEALNWPEHEELMKAIAKMTQKIYEETKVDTKTGGIPGHNG